MKTSTKAKQKITTEQFFDCLQYLVRKLSFEYVPHAMHQPASPFKDADETIFIHERIIIIFWIIDRFFPNKNIDIVSGLLKRCLVDLKIITSKETQEEEIRNEIVFITKRYSEYNEAYTLEADEQQFVLGSVIGKNILSLDKPALNTNTIFWVISDFFNLIKLLKGFFDQYQITNA